MVDTVKKCSTIPQVQLLKTGTLLADAGLSGIGAPLHRVHQVVRKLILK